VVIEPVVIERGDVCWVDFGDPRGSAPAKRRPAVVVQSDRYNRSRIATVVVLPITSNTELARHPGNVFLPALASGLPKDSVVNVSQPMTVDRADVEATGAGLPENLMTAVDAGLRRVVDL
jgi:mRNA interferase MazF